jgi:hypothetical protein
MVATDIPAVGERPGRTRRFHDPQLRQLLPRNNENLLRDSFRVTVVASQPPCIPVDRLRVPGEERTECATVRPRGKPDQLAFCRTPGIWHPSHDAPRVGRNQLVSPHTRTMTWRLDNFSKFPLPQEHVVASVTIRSSTPSARPIGHGLNGQALLPSPLRLSNLVCF